MCPFCHNHERNCELFKIDVKNVKGKEFKIIRVWFYDAQSFLPVAT